MATKLAEDLIFLGQVYGWELKSHKPAYAEMIFKRDGVGLTIWYTKMTVRTAMNHPVKGETQLYRKRVDMALMESLFDNPRTHTNKGYLRKGNGNKGKWRKTNNTDVSELQRKINKQLSNIRERYKYAESN